jgi:WhiB family redox-sensing transcriptional regulator
VYGAARYAAFSPARGEATVQIKEICASCTVTAQCLEWGLDEKHGIWGGMAERSRRLERRRRNKARREGAA